MTQKLPYDHNTDSVNINVRRLNIRFIEEAIRELPNSEWIHPARILFLQTNEMQKIRVGGNTWLTCLIMEFRDINWDMSMVVLEMEVRLRKISNDNLDENDIWAFTFYANSLIVDRIEELQLHTKEGSLFKLPSFSFATQKFIGVAGSPVSVITLGDSNMFGTLNKGD